ncbi:Branched-chain-amino-acid aminotransferase [Symbiodinium microadriaticum]|uniref:Branched-chain-amino-acid aminotransferase n=1 Tax=Symbiodinium microadriaticum TaxID=2951 RepID=A0A1Q9CA69_SYMMI|nr:Branched-chain-amino-acid aminotransferase [Symbiodinium microadriaticum]
MLQSLATFGAGVFTGQGLQTCHASLPQCSLGEQDRARLLVRCHGAQIPSLPAPGVLSRQRPQLSIRLGATERQTGPGDFMESDKLYGMPECNWRFGDVMTFLVTFDDVLREGGLRFSLLAKTDFRFGPLQMELAQTVELGAGALDLKNALLTCAPVQSRSPFAGPATARCWDSPVLRIDLIQMQSACPLDIAATAFVSVTYFGDPSSLLQKAEKADKPLLKRIAGPCLDPCHWADPDAQGSVIPSFAEPDSEQPPDSEYTTCEVPSFLYNSWSPEAESFPRVASPAGPGEHFVWPGARSRDAEMLRTTGLKGFAAGKQGIQKSQDGLSPSTSLPQPLVVKLRLQQPVPSTKLESDGVPTCRGVLKGILPLLDSIWDESVTSREPKYSQAILVTVALLTSCFSPHDFNYKIFHPARLQFCPQKAGCDRASSSQFRSSRTVHVAGQKTGFHRKSRSAGRGLGWTHFRESRLSAFGLEEPRLRVHPDQVTHSLCTWKNGEWNTGHTFRDPYLPVHMLANVFHYGQALFEGFKGFHTKQGDVCLFADRLSWARMNHGCRRFRIPEVPVQVWDRAVHDAVKDNVAYVPPHGTNGALYVRPFIFGSGPRLGLGPSPEYTFVVFVNPVGSYYKNEEGAMQALDGLVNDSYDRAAPLGCGDCKAAGNYAADLESMYTSKRKGYPISLYLDAVERRYIEEFNTSNFVAITKDGKYITPDAPRSVLNSNTNKVLLQLADDMSIPVERRRIDFEAEVDNFAEVGAVGTAVVVTPIRSLTRGDRTWNFQEPQVLRQLRNRVRAIQNGEVKDPVLPESLAESWLDAASAARRRTATVVPQRLPRPLTLQIHRDEVSVLSERF